MLSKVVAVEVEAVVLKEKINLLEKQVEILEMENGDLLKHIMELSHENKMDVLCEIYNKKQFKTILEKELARTNRHGGQISMMIIDVDDFKKVNDIRGHHEGDVVLRHISIILQDCIRKEDYAFRIGGDEFAIILIDADGAPAQIGLRMLKEIRKLVNVGCTIGCADADRGEDYVGFLKRADMLMYSAKNSGKGKVAIMKDKAVTFLNESEEMESFDAK